MSWKRVICEGKLDGPFYNGALFLDIKKIIMKYAKKHFKYSNICT